MAPCRTSDALLKANQNLMAILAKPEDDARQAQQTNPLYPPRSTSTGELPAVQCLVGCIQIHTAGHMAHAPPPPPLQGCAMASCPHG